MSSLAHLLPLVSPPKVVPVTELKVGEPSEPSSFEPQETVQLSRDRLAPLRDHPAHDRPLGLDRVSGDGLINAAFNVVLREVPTTQEPMSLSERDEILAKLQPGDIVLSTRTNAPGLAHLEYWTVGSHYTHCALYIGEGRFVEALDEVVETQAERRLKGPLKVSIVRPPYRNDHERQQVIDDAVARVGSPYDNFFDNSESDALYCSELIEVALKASGDPNLKVPNRRVFGRPITAPDAFLQISGAEVVHDGQSNYWTNRRYQWPFLLGAAAGATIGAAVAGPVGALVGGVAVYEGATRLVQQAQALLGPGSAPALAPG